MGLTFWEQHLSLQLLSPKLRISEENHSLNHSRNNKEQDLNNTSGSVMSAMRQSPTDNTTAKGCLQRVLMIAVGDHQTVNMQKSHLRLNATHMHMHACPSIETVQQDLQLMTITTW